MRSSAVLFVLGLLGGCQQASDRKPVTDEAAQTKERALDAIRATVRDPSSVQLEYVTFEPNKRIVCGQFNAKNAFGAYTGMRAFVFNGIATSLEGESTFDSASAACATEGGDAQKLGQAIVDRKVGQAAQAMEEWAQKARDSAKQ